MDCTLFLDEAQRLAELGYPVFPLAAGSKRPLPGSRGLLDATTDPEQIEKWFAGGDHNVGMATAGLLILDVDHPEGTAWFNSLGERADDLRAAPIQRTPRGGRHFVFRAPPGREFRNTAGKIAGGVDTRATGGYVVASPSAVVDAEKNIAGEYSWLPGHELDVRPEQLPLPPEWLLAALDRTPAKVAAEPVAQGHIANGRRNATLASMAGGMRRCGFEQNEIEVALQSANRRCVPPLGAEEVGAISRSVARYQPAASEGNEARELERLSSRELAEGDFTTRYVIENILPAGVPTVIGGRFKSLKTTIALDLAISAATGTNFLGCAFFNVTEPMRAGVVSCESGLATLKETSERICYAKNLELRNLNSLVWSSTLPRIPADLPAIERFIRNDELGLLVIDPLYLMLGDAAAAASNVYVMGNFLSGFAELIKNTGVTLVLVHHCKKSRGQETGKFDPPELTELAQAGIAEFARAWLLVGPAAEFNPETGSHRLWLNAGGSAGHAGMYGVAVTEGVRPNRVWDVRVSNAGEVRHERAREAEQQKARRQEATEAEQARRLQDALRLHQGGETKSVLRAEAGLSEQAFATAIRSLMKEGLAVGCEVTKGQRKHAGYRATELA